MSEFSGSECVGYLIHADLNRYLSRWCRPTACDQAGTDPGGRTPAGPRRPPHQGRHLRPGMDADPDRCTGPCHPRASCRDCGRHGRPGWPCVGRRRWHQAQRQQARAFHR